MRINKYLAHKGIATRKDADSLVESGAVSINGRRAVLGDKVQEKDKVLVKGTKRKYRYFAFHKPVGVVTHTAQFGEKDARQSSAIKGVFPVGRLDKRSHGLLLLTDDARVTDRLLNPNYVHEKEYRVRVEKELPPNFIKRMESGVNIEGYVTKKCRVQVKGEKRFFITLTEGKKHQIRRMCAALCVNITELERVRVMNIQLGELKPGQSREIIGAELQRFLKDLGLQ